MKEAFLHYIWQHQYFEKTELMTVEGEQLQVLKTGFYHTNAGPDFKEALIKIGDVEWSGSVEVHLKASDWQRHQHQTDQKYNQVVLHVVWEADQEILRTDGTAIPTLELKNRVEPIMLLRYEKLQQAISTIPCASFWPTVPDITKTMMLERALTERLELKGEEVWEIFSNYGNDWEQTTYAILCRSFGFKINQQAFEMLAKVLPWQVVRRHQHNLLQLEALLFGQAGFLEEVQDEYGQQLQKEYVFLSHKYKLKPMQRHQWNFLRMRPANFPTVRLSQLAVVLAQHQHLFTMLLEGQTIKQYESLFIVPVSAYWQQHYNFGKSLKTTQKSIGKSSVQNLIINAVVPLLAAYAQYSQNRNYLEKAIALLEKVKEASNSITRHYEELGWQAKTAADNQAALGLYKLYCGPVNCLRCAIGNKILKQSPLRIS
ncbi:DUF2851 family protein [Pontibacter harenae]|uniref:DUF2851 family protein n=1 Tax=Pontibacter harenae TaxID=2894083 RepID=UPI001E305915|nr:DUF2851 family protein [Pontibacter harenae]MCC9167172.1 DUF2851 family protein [Pontibacter harenae]